jgi:hypothetical protein
VALTGPASTTLSAAVGGAYQAFLPPGHYTLVFSAGGCQSETTQVTITDGRATTQDGTVS